MNEQDLANHVVEGMDMGGVCEYAAERLADFYTENPDNFAAALADEGLTPENPPQADADATARETDGMPAVSTKNTIPLYPHTTDGGAKYLSDKYLQCRGGHREGVFSGARFVVRLDGAPELVVAPEIATAPELLEALQTLEARLTRVARAFYVDGKPAKLREALDGWKDDIEPARAAIAAATGD